MKKTLALLLACLMLFAFAAACGTDDDGYDEPVGPVVDPTDPTDPTDPVDPPPPPPELIRSNTPRDTLVVAYGGEMNGDFINGFGNNAYDLSIKTLLHGYKAVYYVSPSGEFILNPTVVRNLDVNEDADGNKTYTFTLQEDLKWSDGSAITAADYVTSLIFAASPEWAEAGASSTSGTDLLGYQAYRSGNNEYFEGVKLLGDFVFSLTIDGAELPYFYEENIVAYGPTNKAVYAPSVEIISDENGSRFSGSILADAERIASTERFAPTVVAGPYTFVSFENQIATLQRNPHFKGDENGKRPTFEFIVQQIVPDETDIDMLLAGDIDILPNMIEGEKIERVMADEFMNFSSYLRNGYGVLQMVCDWGPTADRNVRWAIALLVDRTALLDQVLGGFGGLVDGEIGEAQWMYHMKQREIRDQLIPIAMNIDRANDHLDQTEWAFEADGTTPFDRAKAGDGTYMRHNAAGQPLVIRHASANATIGAVLELEWLKNTPYAGMSFQFDSPDFNMILDQFYYGSDMADEDRIYSTFSMGTGFSAVYDPYFSWHSDFADSWINANGLVDAELDDLIIDMRRVTPGDKATYAELWLRYQVRWNYLLPAVPLYSNEYFNLFNAVVTQVPTTPFLDWYEIICEIGKFQ
jgi:peptide/nickel transport system substrate-binding protein